MMMPRRRENGLDVFDEFFGDPFFEKDNKIMKTDVKETDKEYTLEVDIPGYNKEDIQIELREGYLTITAKKNDEKEEKNTKYIRRERFNGICSRSYYVGEDLKEEDIRANFRNGILIISFPKEQEKRVEEKRYIPIGE